MEVEGAHSKYGARRSTPRVGLDVTLSRRARLGTQLEDEMPRCNSRDRDNDDARGIRLCCAAVPTASAFPQIRPMGPEKNEAGH